MDGVLPWQAWAVLSAVFAALTAIFAKIGIENVNSDFATFIRTFVIMVALAGFLRATGQFQSLGTISRRTYAVPGALRPRDRRLVAVLLPRPQARQCLAGRADRQAQRRSRRGFRGVFLGERPSLPNWLGIALIAAGAVLIAWKR